MSKDLAEAIYAASHGTLSIEECLKRAELFEKFTEAQEAQARREAYQKSLLPTAPKPTPTGVPPPGRTKEHTKKKAPK